MTPACSAPFPAPTLDAILATDGVSTVFQPIVRLHDRRVVAHEALTRGPSGTALEAPARLFELAAATGRLADLERLCHRSALDAARSAGLGGEDVLFVNVEPDVTAAEDVLYRQHLTDAAIVIEFSERHRFASPRRLLHVVDLARERGWRIALDDVGANSESLVLLGLLDPDFIKVDRAIVQNPPDRERAAVIAAVRAVADETGALVIAEGIETEAHEDYARSFAELGQGWRFGRPQPAVADVRAPLPDGPGRRRRAPAEAATPFHELARRVTPREASADLLSSMTRALQESVLQHEFAPIVLLNLPGALLARPDDPLLPSLVERSLFVATLSDAVGAVEHGPGVRRGALPVDHPLHAEWDVVVLGPHYAAALAARRTGPGPQAGLRYVLTHDRALAATAAEHLIRLVACAA